MLLFLLCCGQNLNVLINRNVERVPAGCFFVFVFFVWPATPYKIGLPLVLNTAARNMILHYLVSMARDNQKSFIVEETILSMYDNRGKNATVLFSDKGGIQL